jgi:hypothetical protein
MTPALILALTLMTAAPPPDGGGEPLPPGAPSDSYELSAWCFGALNEYLQIYEKVKPDLRDIDRMFGTSVVEDQPYQSDMAAARVELKMIGESVTAAEKASPRSIADRGVAAMRQGRGIWSVVEAKTSRELARAWLSWALPDRCDSNARELATRSIVFGKVLKYNANDKSSPPPPGPEPASTALTPQAPETSQPQPEGGSSILRPSSEFAPTPSVLAAPTPSPPHATTQAVPLPTAPNPPPVTRPASQAIAGPKPPPAAEAAAAEPEGAVSPQVLDTGPPSPPPARASAPPPAVPAVAAAPATSLRNSDEPQEPVL